MKPERKVPRGLGQYLLRFPAIHQAQADALATISGALMEHETMDVLQTWTETGGQHLYVFCAGQEYHIARNGNIIRMGVVDDEETVLHSREVVDEPEEPAAK